MTGESLVYKTVDGSITVQFITGIISVMGLFRELEPMHQILKSVLGFEMIVQVLELCFYIFLVRQMAVKSMATVRYYDWFITTPVMLITSIVYYKYQEHLENFENTKSEEAKKKLEEMSFMKFIKENKENVMKIVFFNFLMLLFGYLGETGAMDKMTAFYLGTAAFFMSFYIIYENYAKYSKGGKQLFSILFVVWAIYGIAYLFDPIYKNTTFNGLDIVAKNFFGLYLYFRIAKLKK